MSVTIVYDRQFVRSSEGITPCWLAGDNRTWTDSSRHAKRVRSWSVFHNVLGVSEDELFQIAYKFLGTSQHWRDSRGRDVNDNGYLRWIVSGCKQALSVEEILQINRLRSLSCCVSYWDRDFNNIRKCVEYISSTEDFDRWIGKAKELIAAAGLLGHDAFPIIDFGLEKLSHPSRSSAKNVLLKRGGYYLIEICSSGSSWTTDVRDAMVFSSDKAGELISTYSSLSNASLVDAECQNKPYNSVIRFRDGIKAGMYVQQRVRGHIYLTGSCESAKHYPTVAAAKSVMKKIQPRVEKYGTLEVIVLDNEDQKAEVKTVS